MTAVASERGWAKSAKPRASCPHFKMQEEMELKLAVCLFTLFSFGRFEHLQDVSLFCGG